MKVRVKLYASLGQYMPNGVKGNEMDLDVEAGTSVAAVIDRLSVPEDLCHLVLVNGNYIPPSERPDRILEEGDHLAAWPPVAGG